ncbi:MAG: cupredoxin family protein [Rhodoferax sp.]|nr:cupredoxin family protein [Rhodoferax sp.]
MKTRHALLTISAAFIAVTATAGGIHAGGHGHDESTIGEPGKAAKVTRTVQVDTEDKMRFSPANFSVKQGETIRFVVKNSGKIKHEFVLGKAKELKEHYELMKKFPEMEHAEANMVTVGPGQTGEVIWKFTKAGAVDFACLHPGHYDAGMKGAIKVASAK